MDRRRATFSSVVYNASKMNGDWMSIDAAEERAIRVVLAHASCVGDVALVWGPPDQLIEADANISARFDLIEERTRQKYGPHLRVGRWKQQLRWSRPFATVDVVVHVEADGTMKLSLSPRRKP